MRVLVTGGSGFIGSHVVDQLLESGVTVRILDMVYPTYWDDDGNLEFYKGSILDFDEVRMAMNRVDAVIHLAAVANVNAVVDEPHYSENINVRGTVNILEAMRRTDVDRLVYTSTSWVYSDVEEVEVDETTPLAHPAHLYTATKITSEFYCQAYSNHYDIDTTIVRYGIPYGPRARSGTVLPIFVRLALDGEDLTVHGSGEQYRNFVYVEDLAKGTVLSLKPEAVGEVYNLTGDEKISVNQIANTVQELVDRDIEIVHEDSREGDFSGKDIDNSKATAELGWRPETPFREGVRKYINWYKAAKEREEGRWADVDSHLYGRM
jgi:UDP-glucose 4-epimerase